MQDIKRPAWLKLVKSEPVEDAALLALAERKANELDMTCLVHGHVVDHAFGDCICTHDDE